MTSPSPRIGRPGAPEFSPALSTADITSATSEDTIVIGTSPTLSQSATPSSSSVVPSEVNNQTQTSSSTTGTTSAQPTQSSEQGKPAAASHDGHLAMIISAVTLSLVAVIVIVLLFVWYYIRRRRRRKKARQNEYEESIDAFGFGGLKEEWRERGIGLRNDSGGRWSRGVSHWGRRSSSSDSSDGMDWEEGGSGGYARDAVEDFNPLDMVVDRSVIMSMAWSQSSTMVSPYPQPPPPYPNRNAKTGGVIQSHMIAKRDSSINAVIPPSKLSQEQLSFANAGVPEGGDQVAAMVKLLPSLVVVQYTFTPSHQDEMEVKRGDMLRIVGVFDDGWCLCRKENGMGGVVPMACFQIPGMDGPGVVPDSRENTGVRRVGGQIGGEYGDRHEDELVAERRRI